MSEYTPTTEEIRDYIETGGEPRPWVEVKETEEALKKARGEAFDRWLAAHDAEVRASVVTEEPEWEYGEQSKFDPNTVWVIDPISQSMIWDDIPKGKRVRRRKAGLWEAIPDA